MGAESSRTKKAIAAEVWRTMAQFTMATIQRGSGFKVLKERGLTPGHMKVLAVLDEAQPRPMGMIAEAVGCDPSMATWLIDRLEERGLVERTMLKTDRRVKTVALTPLGTETKDEVLSHLYEPPQNLLALDRDTLEGLRRELQKLPSPPHAFPTRGPIEQSAPRRAAPLPRTSS